MDRTQQGPLSVEEAKAKLKKRSKPAGSPTLGLAGSVLESAKRHPLRVAGVSLALGVAVGFSRRTRKMAFSILRKALGPGV